MDDAKRMTGLYVIAPPIYWPSDRAISMPLASGRATVNPRGMQIALEHVYLTVTDLDRTLAYYRAFFPEWVVRWEGKSSAGRWIHFGPQGDGQPGYLSLAEDPRAAAQPSDVVDDGAYRRAYFDDPDGIEIEFVQKL